MADYRPEIAAAILGLAGFEMVQAWGQVAPSLADLRDADPEDGGIKRQLLDVDILFAALVVLFGLSFAWLTGNYTVLMMMLVIFGIVSFWYHTVQKTKR